MVGRGYSHTSHYIVTNKNSCNYNPKYITDLSSTYNNVKTIFCSLFQNYNHDAINCKYVVIK